ncbi:MAG TPA: ADP-forming succinate--CoA ligase subunit beta [Fibrobacteria bacterium]|nr:ADP-forming succinate--CoA ligase subunit beta [Fibrobacteria bacterium]
MKLLEHEAKAVLRKCGMAVPTGKVVRSPDEVGPALTELGLTEGVLKAQVFTGGRGKAGGVKLFSGAAEGAEIVKKLIGATLVTHQTGPAGEKVGSLLLESKTAIAREIYCSILLDREANAPVLVLSAEGGMEIEEIAETQPEKILKMHPPVGHDLWSFQVLRACNFLSIAGDTAKEFATVLNQLWKVYQQYDASLLEINPLVIDKDGHVVLLDCKFIVDDNAEYRQKGLGDADADKTAAEIESAKYGLSYVSLDGTVGCMVNGAGLAMATLDLIASVGLMPANFLDVGGSANEEAVTKAFEIVLTDDKVQVILVNIFGGIMKCDIIAQGVINAARKLGVKVPIVVRLQGTNVEQGKKLLAESGLALITADGLDDAAKKVAEAAKGVNA